MPHHKTVRIDCETIKYYESPNFYIINTLRLKNVIKSFPLVIGYVNRRVASDRVEVTVHDARFLDAESQFRPDKGLVYVRDNGQTRLGEFIQAVLRDSENQIATHDYDKAAGKLASCNEH